MKQRRILLLFILALMIVASQLEKQLITTDRYELSRILEERRPQ